VLCHALAVPAPCHALLRAILAGRVVGKAENQLAARPLVTQAEVDPLGELPPSIRTREGDRDTAAVIYGESYIYKPLRRIEEGLNPDVEIGRELSAAGFAGVAQVVGYVEYRRGGSAPATLGVLRKYVPNQGTAWQYTLDQLSAYFERVAALSREYPPVAPHGLPLVGSDGDGQPMVSWPELLGGYLEPIRTFAHRTAELHKTLARIPNPAFVPETFGKLYQRSVYQSMRNQTGRVVHRLARGLDRLPLEARSLAERVISYHDELLRRFRGVLAPEMGGSRIRCHGNFHLARLLYTGRDFVVMDFQGDPARTIGERRLKRSPLRDVASLIRSFDYAVQSVLYGLASSRGRSPGLIRAEDQPALAPWATAWYDRVAREYVTEYVRGMGPSELLPRTEESLRTFLELLVLEKALQEIDSDLTHRPEWVAIPLRGALRLLGYDPNDHGLRL
jgi:maltose alpha-D-glucosyltransferase/alpha-amylase